MKKIAVFLLASLFLLAPFSTVLAYKDAPAVTVASWFTPAPSFFQAQVTWYGPGVMLATKEWRKIPDDPGVIGYITLESPADIGKYVWIDYGDGQGWQGPYLVVDCAAKGDIYDIISNIGSGGEVSFEIASARGWVKRLPSGKLVVCEGCWVHRVLFAVGHLPTSNEVPVDYQQWWLDQAVIAKRWEKNPIYQSPHSWKFPDGRILDNLLDFPNPEPAALLSEIRR